MLFYVVQLGYFPEKLNFFKIIIFNVKTRFVLYKNIVIVKEYGVQVMDRAGKMIGLRWAHDRRIYGKNVGIVCFDTGVAAEHPDFNYNGKIVAFKDFVNGKISCYDDNGHGTHVAGIASGTGRASEGLYCGVAPESHLIVLKILDYKGGGNIEDVLNGVEWVLKNKSKYNIRVANISIGTGKEEHISEDSELVHGVNALWDAGIVVCVAAGNNGPEPGSIGAPGISRKVITIGACDDNQAVFLNGKTMKNYSGRGPTQFCIKKPDLVAPGSNITSCSYIWNTKNGFGVKKFQGQNNGYYTVKSGTSMATPIVSGTVALLLGKYPEMTNREVKIRLKKSAEDLGLPHAVQGWGKVNVKDLFFGKM